MLILAVLSSLIVLLRMGLQSEGPEQTNGNCKANPNLRVVGLGSRWVKGGWVLGAAAASRLLRFGSFCCFSFSSFRRGGYPWSK